jgi:DUF4097 and DUF4098 domain-containing protein YvlB
MGEHRFQTAEIPALHVDVPSGRIDVRTVDGNESVVVVEGNERLVEETTVELEGSTIVVKLRGNRFFSIGRLGRGDSLRFTASVPHGSSARFATASADVAIDGRLGALALTTASGDLTARGEVERDAKIKTVSGDVRIEQVGGSLTCQTVSGDVEVASVGGSVEARSVSGDVRVRSLREGSARFHSVSGDVEFGIASGSFLDVDAGSVSGRLVSAVPLAGAPSDDGDGGPTVVVRGKTVSGDVRVRRAS